MYKNNNILVGKSGDKEAYLLLKNANRHGLITGASGSGKTITLKVLAEGFSDAKTPVFMIDIKGDLSATSLVGVDNENIQNRISKLGLEDFNFKGYPVNYFDVYGKSGLKLSIPIGSIETRMLAKLLNLTNAQEGVLAIIFKIAKDNNIKLVTLDDLRVLTNNIGENRSSYTLSYGNITSQSIGAIQRSILALSEDGGDILFGTPEFDVSDFIHFDSNTGNATINILDARELFNHPTLYATVVLTILDKIYDTYPEVGDLEKPKLVFFFDEAHLVFNEMSDTVIKQLIQIVKLIRSKGVGIYFISQSPGDIPDEILAQLSNRIQHVLRSYTKTDEAVIKAAARSYRENSEFKTEDVIKTLGTGEALISFLNETGEPEIVDKFTILPPQSKMGIIDDNERLNLINNSYLFNKYNQKVVINQTSTTNNASKTIAPQVSMSLFQKNNNVTINEMPKPPQVETPQKTTQKQNKEINRLEKKITNKVENKIINKMINKIFK